MTRDMQDDGRAPESSERDLPDVVGASSSWVLRRDGLSVPGPRPPLPRRRNHGGPRGPVYGICIVRTRKTTPQSVSVPLAMSTRTARERAALRRRHPESEEPRRIPDA